VEDTLLSAVLLVTSACGAEPGKTESFEAHLARLHYGVAVRQKDKPNRLILEGTLGGKRVLFWVDTGWGLTALDERAARGLKSAAELGVILEDPILGPITNGVVMEKLGFGNSEFLNQPASIRRLEMDSNKMDVDGVLGMDFLLRNHCLVDCGNGRLYFRGEELATDESSELDEHLRKLGYMEVPMRWDFGYVIETRINNQDVRLVVDTGAFNSVLDETQISRLSLKTEKVRNPETGTMVAQDIGGRAAGVGEIGVHRTRVSTPISLQIGSHSLTASRFVIVNLKSWGIGVPENGATTHGLLGEDLLITNGALINCSGKKIWFRLAKAKSR